jgi:hypothetical protein
MQCDECHGTGTFRTAAWPHPGSFAMTFGHAGRRCSECHAGQVYAGTQSDCASCHLDDWQATQNPNHTLAGFGTDCQTCHNTALWNGASVEHPASFPLENAHQRACSACHQGGVYKGLDPSCFACARRIRTTWRRASRSTAPRATARRRGQVLRSRIRRRSR